MRTTNLRDPSEPFDGICWDTDYPIVVAVAATDAGAGLAFARFDRHRTRDLEGLNGCTIGYELISNADHLNSDTIELLDERLAQWELHADVLTGHSLDAQLKALCAAAAAPDRLRFLGELAGRWPRRIVRVAGVRPQLIDTAADIDGAHEELERTCAVAPRLHSWYLSPASASPRVPITTAAASVLLTARHLGWCSWQLLDLDTAITASASQLWSSQDWQ